ncbi:MAG: YvcK family protein [Elusimicrobia bacterium]|nr:YvcK family protein [Elusimicrobiota bacterium]
MKKIVTIGGGTGHYALLRGLKNYDVDLTAIVSVFDDGGSTGKLRTEFGMLAPGDIRNCLVALSHEADIMELAALFEYRYDESLESHNLGNLILKALQDIKGDMAGAIKAAAKILRIKGRVLPVSVDPSHLRARTDSGRLLRSQVEVSYPDHPDGKERITEVWLEPKAHIHGASAMAVREADLIVICPGCLYGSVVPNFLVAGMAEALKKSAARKAYVCNLVTKQGTYGFAVKDFVREIARFSGVQPDAVIFNTLRPSQDVVDKYNSEVSGFVEPDISGLEDGVARGAELLKEHDLGGKRVVRHDPERLARMVMDLL